MSVMNEEHKKPNKSGEILSTVVNNSIKISCKICYLPTTFPNNLNAATQFYLL